MANNDEKKNIQSPRTVSLKDSEWKTLRDEADRLGVTKHSLLAYILRKAVKDIREKKLKIPTTTESKIDTSQL